MGNKGCNQGCQHPILLGDPWDSKDVSNRGFPFKF